MKAVLFFLLGLLVGACAQSAAIPPTVAEGQSPVEDLVSKTVALVRQVDSSKLRPYCSGVWVGDDVILTANHCVEDEQGLVSYAVQEDVLRGPEERPNPSGRSAWVLRKDAGHDLALLRVIGGWPQHRVARPRTSPTVQGMPVRAVGHSKGLWWSFSSGHVAAVRRINLDPNIVYVQTTAPTSPGNSGCGLWDDAGDLVGIAHAGVPSGQNLNFYVSAQYVADFLRGS